MPADVAVVVEIEGTMDPDVVRCLGDRSCGDLLESIAALDGSRWILVARGSLASVPAVRACLGDQCRVWAADGGRAVSRSVGRPVLVVVERRFDSSVPRVALRHQGASCGWCLAAHRVRFLGSYVSLNGDRSLCLYDAADVESVRIVQKSVGLPVLRIWGAADR